MLMRPRLPLVAFIALIVVPLRPLFADDTASDLYKTNLPSIMTLTATTSEGTKFGTGFLAIKDGIAVTALHVVAGATSVTANFANGEEDEVTGIIDKDDKADVAIVRVKEFGFPLLKLNAVEPTIGTKAYAIGAPRGFDFTLSDGIISQFRDMNGVTNLQFTCPISPGNSGGPLMAADGSVMGVVNSTIIDAQNVNFAIPIRKVLALDATLPTKPWDSIKSSPSTPGGTAEDAAIADAVSAIADGLSAYMAADIHFINNEPKDAVGTRYYQAEISTVDATDELKNLQGAESDVPDLIADLASRLSKEHDMLSLLDQAIKSDIDDNGHDNSASRHWHHHDAGWNDPNTKEPYRASLALFNILRMPSGSSLKNWESKGYFATRFTPAQNETIDFVTSPANYIIGGTAYLDTPNCIQAVENDMVCGELGLQDADVIEKINGSSVTSLQDLNAAAISNAGKHITLTVLRDGNERELSATVPTDLPRLTFDYERK